ncbi:MAG TPA: type IV pili twitching motility protein PilT, partial [Rhodocyclaceae bacterium]|nr:type IV pili twitching motility protein PilT [Rhodocyclaceae bacterium]
MGTMQRIFQLMAEKQASDLFVSVGAAIHIKINGNAMPVNQQIMDGPTIMGLLHEILNDKQMREFEDEMELNTSY